MNTIIERVIIIVLDSLGVGFLPDAEDYGDLGANTLAHIAYATGGLYLPNMQALGLGNICVVQGIDPVNKSGGAYGRAIEKSKGKDTIIGHWEIAGIITENPLPTYPNGFPKEIIDEFENKTGKKVIGNKVASGTDIIDELGDEHLRTGDLIVYTSADSVFQIAAHEDIVSIEKLYEYCKIARKILKVGRVIARPFLGESKNYKRTTNRHDFALKPNETILDRLKEAGKDVIGVGKINDIFGGQGITDYVRTTSNANGIDKTIEYIKEKNKGLIFTNLVDFDMNYGHRRDPKGYKMALEEFDKKLPEIKEAMNENDILIITADHGCDPIFKGTDHTREYIPVLVYGDKIKSVDIGTRDSFSDIARTIEEAILGNGKEGSFYKKMI